MSIEQIQELKRLITEEKIYKKKVLTEKMGVSAPTIKKWLAALPDIEELRQENKTDKTEYFRNYERENPRDRSEYRAKFSAENRQSEAERLKKWRAENRDVVLEKQRAYRAKKRNEKKDKT